MTNLHTDIHPDDSFPYICNLNFSLYLNIACICDLNLDIYLTWTKLSIYLNWSKLDIYHTAYMYVCTYALNLDVYPKLKDVCLRKSNIAVIFIIIRCLLCHIITFIFLYPVSLQCQPDAGRCLSDIFIDKCWSDYRTGTC